MGLRKRAVRRAQRDGIGSVVHEGIDIIYRKRLLRFISELLYKKTPVLTRRELRKQIEGSNCYIITSDRDDIKIPRKKSVPKNKSLEDIKPGDTGPSFVTVVQDATLLGPLGVGRTSEGKLIADTVATPSSTDYRLPNAISRTMKSHGVVQTWTEISTPGTRSPSRQLTFACPLIQMYGKNYYHWTGETLTKLRGVEHFRDKHNIKPTLLIPKKPTSWMLESLKLLGYDEKNFLSFSDFVVNADKLLIPSYPGPSASDLRWLRSRMVSGAARAEPPNKSNRLLIIRKDATRRRISNIDEVIAALQKQGFEAVDPGNYSVAEQVKMFNDAEVIIGAHGAGLTNIVYSDRIKIIELFGKKRKTTFYRIAKLLDHEYTDIECEDDGIDIKVNIPELRLTVEEVIKKNC